MGIAAGKSGEGRVGRTERRRVPAGAIAAALVLCSASTALVLLLTTKRLMALSLGTMAALDSQRTRRTTPRAPAGLFLKVKLGGDGRGR
jgi:hypothetical protein